MLSHRIPSVSAGLLLCLSPTRKWALVFLVVSVGLRATETVYAAPRYSAEIPGVERVIDSPSPVFLSNRTEIIIDKWGESMVGQMTRQAIAAASYGQLRGSSNADVLTVFHSFPHFSGSGTGAQENSDFRLDDLVISGPPGNIMVSFNFVISGSIGAETVSTGPSNFYQSSARVRARIINLQSSGGSASGHELGEMNVDSYGSRSATGIFSSFPVNSDGMAMGTTPAVTTFAGDTGIQFWLGLETSAAASVGFGAGPGRTNGDASFTFGFPTSGPVANLPDGYTLDSPDGCIVDNRFVLLGGDIDLDCDVDRRDAALFSFHFGLATGSTWTTGDFNADAATTLDDLAILQSHLDVAVANSPLSSVQAIPEPQSLALLVLAALATAYKWRRRRSCLS